MRKREERNRDHRSRAVGSEGSSRNAVGIERRKGWQQGL